MSRILLLLDNRENTRLLSEWLAQRHETLVPSTPELPDEPFDLCIVDAPTLYRLWERVRTLKQADPGGFLPFLLVTPRQDLKYSVRHMWTAVDEIIFAPVEKTELQVRLEMLLRARDSREALRQSEERYRLLVEGVSDYAIAMLDPEGRVSSWNKGIEHVFGYPQDAILGKPYECFFLPEDRTEGRPRALLDQAAREGRSELVGWLSRRDDGRVWADVLLTVLRDGGQHLVGYSMVVRDLSERRKAEEQERQYQALKELDGLKDQFLSVLSHELRTPINAITGFGSILSDGVVGPVTPQQKAYLDKMLAGAETLLALVNDLLDMSRIQAGKFSLNPHATDVAQVAHEAVENLAPLAEQRHLRLVDEVPDDLPELVADRQRVMQVLVNLIGNAIKFTPEGGTIWVRARRSAEAVRFEVQDTGIGISPENMGRLFQPFVQVDMSYTRQAGGTGLGLSISKALVEAHGGTIGATSTPGRGSTFWFALPRSAKAD